MKDFLNKELCIDDAVIIVMPRYEKLIKGVIIAFTPTKARVEYGRSRTVNKLCSGDQMIKL